MCSHTQIPGSPEYKEKGQLNMYRKRAKLVTTKTVPEAEEFRVLNSKIQENRDKHAAERFLNNARRVYAVICWHLWEKAAAEKAEEQRMRQRKRAYCRQMRALANRILLCLAVCFGVCVSWWFDLVRVEFFLGVCFVCACIISFTWGIGSEKGKQFGGDER